ncbi:MAG: TspO/MBR family protein [Clostridia bacterium]|nr:TspO/MBR family protein [Clostridia bacterium]
MVIVMRIKNIWQRICADLRRINIRTTLIFAIAVLVGGILVSIFGGNRGLYSVIIRPAFAPPAFVFAIVWTILYFLIGAAAGAVFGFEDKCLEAVKYKGLFLFVLMLFFNYIWYPLFFGGGMFFIALLDILVMIILSLAIRKLFGKIYFTAKLIMTVYIIWLVYAALLNFSVVLLN